MLKVPTDVTSFAAWMKAEREKRGWSTTQLANAARAIAHREGSAIRLTQQTVSGFEQPGKAKRIPEWLRYVRVAFEDFDSGAPPPALEDLAEAGPREDRTDEPPAETVDAGEVVPIPRLDFSLAMGPGVSVDAYSDGDPISFDLAYIRTFTRTAPRFLRLGFAIGDSMWPTLQPGDMVWIDGSQTRLNQQDRVWAVSINGGAAIKRLRRLKNGRVLVISDNANIGNDEVGEDEIVICGKVIRFVRDL